MAAATIDEPNKAPDEKTLREAALNTQKRMETEMLIKSLSAPPESANLLRETETETPVPLAVAAYAENFNQPVTDPAKAAA